LGRPFSPNLCRAGSLPATLAQVEPSLPLDRVAQLLGHESVDTARIYATPSEQDLQREVGKIALRRVLLIGEAGGAGACARWQLMYTQGQ
jgi:hypothetical protein